MFPFFFFVLSQQTIVNEERERERQRERQREREKQDDICRWYGNLRRT